MTEQHAKSEHLFEESRFLIYCGVFFMALAVAGFCVVTMSSYNMGWKALALVAGILFAWASGFSVRQGFASKKMARLWKNLEDYGPDVPAKLRELCDERRNLEAAVLNLENDLMLRRKDLRKIVEKIEDELSKQ